MYKYRATPNVAKKHKKAYRQSILAKNKDSLPKHNITMTGCISTEHAILTK